MKIQVYKLHVAAVLCCLGLLLTGCKKEERSIEADALVLDLGNPAADGCGWMIQINNTYYKPEHIAEEFKKDSLIVRVNYRLLQTRYSCGIAANIGMPFIKINTIKEKHDQ